MYCKNCNAEITDGIETCPSCGTAIGSDAPPKKKKGLPKLIIIILAVLLLGAGAFFGFTLWRNARNYDLANSYLQDRNYDKALAIYTELADYKDSAQQVQKLKKLQKSYDRAMEMLDKAAFSDAQTAFSKLADYRDSRQYAEYAEAQAAFTEAGKAKEFAAAAELFISLGDFKDSAQMASSCYLEAAHAATEKDGSDAAQAYLEKLTEQQRAEYEAAYHDAEILTGWEEALQVRYDMEQQVNTVGADYTGELEMLEPLLELPCKDLTLKKLLEQYYDTVEKQQKTLAEDGYVDDEDVLEFYETQLERAYILNEMHEDYDLLKDLDDLCTRYVGVEDYYEWCVEIETMLSDWYYSITNYQVNEKGQKYLQFDNTTDYWYTLEITVGYFDKNDELITEEEWTIPMNSAMKSIQLVLEVPEDMESWDILYDFSTYEETTE